MTGAEGVTTTDATGTGTTLIVADPLFPSLVAVTVTGPPTTRPVTIPVEDTLTTFGSLDDHDIVRPGKALPDASRVDAES
jgi:hypothetical protein